MIIVSRIPCYNWPTLLGVATSPGNSGGRIYSSARLTNVDGVDAGRHFVKKIELARVKVIKDPLRGLATDVSLQVPF